MTSLLPLLPPASPLFPSLSSLSGSFLIEDMKLLPSLPCLTKLELDGHVYRDKNAASLHVFSKIEPNFLLPLLDCSALQHLTLPLVDAKFVRWMP
jgi:hypothetical protein